MLHGMIAKAKSVIRPLANVRFQIEEGRYRGVPILRGEGGNDYIAQTLLDGRPTAIGKLGASELGGVRHYLRCRDASGQCPSWGKHRTMLYRNAGVYPPDSAIHSRFCREFLEAVGELDVLAVWFRWGEREVVRQYAPKATYVGLTSLEPEYHANPWSRNLAGKRVLVISPFAESVRSQYARRREVWAAKPDVLPEFELDTIRAPLSAALVPPEHPDWFAALDHMRREMDRRTFDVAMVGAGAWSVPLAVHAKRLGKWGIHLGGGLQLIFGIKGARWENNSVLGAYFNDAWVRPSGAERPATMTQVENGCYW
jgi:hypothetical protein